MLPGFSMMMVVMMTTTGINVAIRIFAGLVLVFQFQGRVDYAVLLQLFLYRLFDRKMIPIRYNMHRGIILHTVHTPDVDMMNIRNAINFC